MTCGFMHKLCKAGCDNHVCRAFFPEKQPLIDPKSKDVCLGDDYAVECLLVVEAILWREERRLKGLTEKCPFATNNVCSRHWQWRCDAAYPFILTTYEIREGTDDIPVRDEDGNVKFTYDKNVVNNTCLSGDVEIYMECPNYKDGVLEREFIKNRNLKNK